MVKSMAKDKKLYTHISAGGIGSSEYGVSLIKNMIPKDGANVKRHGHKNILEITDKDLNPLRINGIFDYSFVDGDSLVKKKIVHAGNMLFSLDEDFKNPQKIEIPKNLTLNDERTRAILRGSELWIAGGGDVLIYNGSEIKSPYLHKSAYVPETTEENGEKKESPNLFTNKRINTFEGTTYFRDSHEPNVFLLDQSVKYGTEFLLEIKIRTRTSEESESATTSKYIGVDSLGREVGKIVTLRYQKSAISENSHYFLAEPIKDELGNIINLKIENEVLTYDKLPFGFTLKNGREVRLSFDLPAPIKGENNVFIKYIAEESGEEALIKNAKILSSASGEKGGEIMLLNFGDNKIYFTDEKRGFFYLPRKNVISIGSDGEKISAVVKLSDNIVGVFKKDSFFRIKFSSANIDGYEIVSSTDLIGAYSTFSTSVVDYDCLVFNALGVCGVSEYKSVSNVFSCLRQRSSKISEFLSKYTNSERENAQSIAYKSRYYLFIGGDVYIADSSKKYKEKGKESDAFEYEWWIWQGCPARILYSDGRELYFGTENGEIRKFYDGYLDVCEKEFSNQNLSLILNNEGDYTEFIIPKTEEFKKENCHAHISSHKRLLSKNAIYEDGVFYLEKSDMFFSDNSVKIYQGDALMLYDQSKELTLKTEADEIDLVFKSVTVKDTGTLVSGQAYDIYLDIENGCDYEIMQGENGLILLWNGEKIKVANENIVLTVIENTPIECVYKTEPLDFETVNPKTLYNLFLRLTPSTEGEVEIALETEKTTLKKKIFISKPISFDSFSLENVTLNAPFKSTTLVQSYLRNFESLSVEIKSKGRTDFGLEGISLLYLKSPKAKRI